MMLLRTQLLLLSCLAFWPCVEMTEDSNESSFNLTVVILTMNRPHSLSRLLRSLDQTDFENKEDFFDVEIHVDKSLGEYYNECVK